jgi:DNA polymerase III gamma/tau subunit
MTYIVLARKWRPMTFDDVAGQEHITRTLMKRSIAKTNQRSIPVINAIAAKRLRMATVWM